MALLQETNAQYYSGQQAFVVATTGVNQAFTCTFNTNLVDSPIANYTVKVNGNLLSTSKL